MNDIKEVLKNVWRVANAAYWDANRDCGSDYDKDSCDDCKHKRICEANKNIQAVMDDWKEGEK